MRLHYTLVLIVMTLAINMISYGLVSATRNTGGVTRYLRIQTFTDENSSKEERGFRDVVKKMMQNARVKTARDLVKNNVSFEMIYKKGVTPTDLYKALKLEFVMRLAYGFTHGITS
ncbi:putative RxLR effector [Phytophthora palmivora]|uniref:RxLR effector n=1 Tax=Phytophthora palmivora TaxID=4796 RepID=A0A2P4XA41_9STRA|nr:putative RxLR effector [Phytophthora palmivora]